MMESSEQCAYDGSLDPDDSSSGTERIVVTSYEDYAREVMPLNQGDEDQASEQVLGYIDEENATLVLQSQEIELNGKRLILAQGTGGDEIIVFVSSEQDPSVEHSFEEAVTGHSPDNHTLSIECGSNNLEAVKCDETHGIEVIETNDSLQNIDKNGTAYVEQTHELAYVDSDNNHYSSGALGNAIYHVQEKDDTTEMVFIPTTSQVISGGNNTRLLHLADVAHSEWATSELHEKEVIDCSRKISEGSVIVSQTHIDSDSSKVEDLSVHATNEQENDNSLHNEHIASENAMSPAIVENSSLMSIPPRDIDNAVSVIHVTSSTLAHDQDWRKKNIQEDQNQIVETGQSDVAFSVLPTIANNLECSNLKETLDSELSLESPLIEESSNHSQLKDCSDSSNKDDNVNSEPSVAVGKSMDEDTNESINFPSQLPSSENIDEDDASKQKYSLSCNDESNTSMDVDQSQNLSTKISGPSLDNCENEMDYTNSEVPCSEISTRPERTYLSRRHNSESKSSFFSDNSLSKDHNLRKIKKLKSVSSIKVKKSIDEYEFENSSSNLDQEFNHNSSLDGQPSNLKNSSNISTDGGTTKVSHSVNPDNEGVAGNLTFQGALIAVTDDTKLNENLTDGETDETLYDNSQELFDQSSQDEEENNSTKMLKSTKAKFFKNKQNSASSEINYASKNKKPAIKTQVIKESLNIVDNKSKEKDTVISSIASSDETTVKPPQRTYVRKRKTSDSDRNIELFSLDDLSDPKDETSSYLTPKIFCPDGQKDQIMNDENNLTDEDGYVNLMPSEVTSRIKAKGTTPQIDDRRTRSLRPRSSDQLEKNTDNVIDAEDSVSTCWGAYLMETSFKPTNTETTEKDVPKASSPDPKTDSPKTESPKSFLKKRVRTPTSKKISVKNDSYKSGQQWDKLMKSSPIKMKDASSDKRKIREKVKKQVEKTLRNTENFNSSQVSMPHRKKGRPSKDGKKCISISHSSFSSVKEEIKTCGIRFLNDNSTENNSCAIIDPCIASTSTQDVKNYQYTCLNCNFVSNIVNNLISHLKFCKQKSSPEMKALEIDYKVNDMAIRQRIRGEFSESTTSTAGKSSTSRRFPNGSIENNNEDEPEHSGASGEGPVQENGGEYERKEENYYEELRRQHNLLMKNKYGFSENDIVWVELNQRYWPALVYQITDEKFILYLVDRPNKKGKDVSCVRMDMPIDEVRNRLHIFDNVTFTKKLLAEAEKLPGNAVFLKAVAKSNTYLKRTLVYNKRIDTLRFFNIHKSVEFFDDDSNEENPMVVDDTIDVNDLMEVLFDGLCDMHVIDIYNGVVESKRHKLHQMKHKNRRAASELKHMSWFGPFKNNSQMQIKLHDYFIDLFKAKFGNRANLVSYIYEVWIPEGIIKAISIVKRKSLLEAQIIFYKQDMSSVPIEDFVDCEDS